MQKERTVLVTGCSDHGLGSALAIALHKQGWRVFASARNLSKLSNVKAAGIECVEMDVESSESVAKAVDQVIELTGGSLDALINNAGTGYNMPIMHLDIDKMHKLFELNAFSIVRTTQAFVPLMLKSTMQPFIANNTAGSGLLGCGLAFQGAYNASKAAAASLTECLRLELAPFGIRVINIVTGAVKSTFITNTTNNTSNGELPPDSIYNVAKPEIEKSMMQDESGSDRMDTETWAMLVAGDLSRKNPAHMIFRGSMSNLARFAALLPIGVLDKTMKRMTGLDVLEERIVNKHSR
ncbi:hypothetical protein VHEMI03061 [[Torrubiella] hemipterigena]|uniref:Uncharacterized protein n=1 Tax=[Torrubiella] hemipterigena TaxID=1531966 RepID=A0A0A1TCB6_9HYPO|nr:hypothetical protein VHEMI03061 [[Torrubiella] hemipterigena]